MSKEQVRQQQYRKEAIKELTDALMAAVSEFRHERSHVGKQTAGREVPSKPKKPKKAKS